MARSAMARYLCNFNSVNILLKGLSVVGLLIALPVWGQRASFVPAGPAGQARPYDYQCKLQAGRVFFGPDAITVLATDVDLHHPEGQDWIDVFRLVWDRHADLKWKQRGQQTEAFTRIWAGGAKPVSTLLKGYDRLEAGMAAGRIAQRWYTADGQLAFELKGKGGSDWAGIAFRLEGLPAALKAGQIVLQGRAGTVRLTPPVLQVKRGGRWRGQPCGFAALGGGRFGFVLPPSVQTADSVWIDPQLVFSSYSGSLADNWGCTATFDTAGHTYLAGMAFDVGFPTTVGSFQPRFAGGSFTTSVDVGIQKFSADGRTLLASTYYGGSGQDVPHSIVCNTAGELIVMGTTSSANLPVTGGGRFLGGQRVDPHNDDYVTYDQGSDLFLARFSTDLTALRSGRYLGGTGNDGLSPCVAGLVANYGDQFRGTVDVDAAGRIYLGSTTVSSNFPMMNAIQPTYQGFGDGVICQLSANLDLLFSTYVGGAGTDLLNSITLDDAGRIGFCGGSTSGNLPVTAGAYQVTAPGGTGVPLNRMNAFVGVLGANRSMEYLSYTATDAYDQAFFADFDLEGRVIVLGQTTGAMPNFTASPVGSPTGGLFIQRFTRDGRRLDLALRFGSLPNRPNLSPTAFRVDQCDQIYFSGWGGEIRSSSCNYLPTTTTGLPVSRDAIKPMTDGRDFYVCVLLPSAEGLKYATFFGGNGPNTEHVDGGTSRFDPRGFIYQAVCAGCQGTSDFPTTPGVYSPRNRSSNCNQAAFKIDLTPLYLPFEAAVTPSICPQEAATLTHNARNLGDGYVLWGNGDSTALSASPIVYQYPRPGNYTIVVRGRGPGCPNSSIDTVAVRVKEGVPKPKDTLLPYCLGDTVTLRANLQPHLVRWQPPRFLLADTGDVVQAVPRNNVVYQLIVENRQTGCRDSAVWRVNAKAIPLEPTVTVQKDSCAGRLTLRLAVGGEADSTRWVILGQAYLADTVRLTRTEGINTTAQLFRVVQGCRGLAELPLSFRLPEVQLPGRILKDSTLDGCTSLRYRFNLGADSTVIVRWRLDQEPVGFARVLELDGSAGPGRLEALVFYKGCQDTLSMDFRPSRPLVPNVVTLNGDELNAAFKPLNLPSDAKLSIFNRWGQTVARQLPADQGFSFAGQDAGVFFFLIETPGAQSCRGWVEVVKP